MSEQTAGQKRTPEQVEKLANLVAQAHPFWSNQVRGLHVCIAKDILAAGYLSPDQVAAKQREAVEALLMAIETHNGTPVTSENLRYAATHEALCRSWIFDVLMGLAAATYPTEEES